MSQQIGILSSILLQGICTWLLLTTFDSYIHLEQTYILAGTAVATLPYFFFKDSDLKLGGLRNHLFITAFIQVSLWVFDPQNPNHEPRSVFMISVAGFVSYWLHVTELQQKLEALNEQVDNMEHMREKLNNSQ